MNTKEERRGREVTIRGVTYPSKTAAAKALGVHRTTIYHAERRGNVNTAGLSSGKVTRPTAVRDIIVLSKALLQTNSIVKMREYIKQLRGAHARLEHAKKDDTGD